MKKIDTLNKSQLKPKQQTIDFLLRFSKSLEIVKMKDKSFLMVKN